MSDEDVEAYMDPELDPVDPGEEGPPGPLSLSQLVAGIHVAAALALTPFLWLAYRAGNLPQLASLTVLLLLLLVAARVMGQIAARRQ